MKLYSVFDAQFNVFSEPFLAADDVAAQRLMVQTAAVSEEFRCRLSVYNLYCLAVYDPTAADPLDLMCPPVLVTCGDKLVFLVAQSEHLMHSVSDKYERSDLEDD